MKVEAKQAAKHPLFLLSEEELDLVLQLVVASGSLKQLAEVYDVTYPTIRIRLNRLIAHVRQFMGGSPPDPMIELLADFVERGEMTVSAAQAVRQLYRLQKG